MYKFLFKEYQTEVKTITLMYTVNVHIPPLKQRWQCCNDSVNQKMNYHEIGIINQRELVPKREAKIERRRITANPILKVKFVLVNTII